MDREEAYQLAKAEWENGDSTPDSPAFVNLLKAFGVDPYKPELAEENIFGLIEYYDFIREKQNGR